MVGANGRTLFSQIKSLVAIDQSVNAKKIEALLVWASEFLVQANFFDRKHAGLQLAENKQHL